MADDLARPVDFTFPFSMEEAFIVIGALQGYVASWHQHYKDDAGGTHSPEEWEEIRVSTGRLIWRLEEAAAPAGHVIEHSGYAVKPPPDEDGGAGVREPRRPLPSAPSAGQHLRG